MRIALFAGEASGDLLGEGLIHALRERFPEAVFEGIAGPRMQAAGCETLYPMERLSVMGLVEVAGRMPEVIRMRERLVTEPDWWPTRSVLERIIDAGSNQESGPEPLPDEVPPPPGPGQDDEEVSE